MVSRLAGYSVMSRLNGTALVDAPCLATIELDAKRTEGRTRKLIEFEGRLGKPSRPSLGNRSGPFRILPTKPSPTGCGNTGVRVVSWRHCAKVRTSPGETALTPRGNAGGFIDRAGLIEYGHMRSDGEIRSDP